MTAVEVREGDNPPEKTSQGEPHALLDELHEEQRAAKRAAVPVMSWPSSK